MVGNKYMNRELDIKRCIFHFIHPFLTPNLPLQPFQLEWRWFDGHQIKFGLIFYRCFLIRIKIERTASDFVSIIPSPFQLHP